MYLQINTEAKSIEDLKALKTESYNDFEGMCDGNLVLYYSSCVWDDMEAALRHLKAHHEAIWTIWMHTVHEAADVVNIQDWPDSNTLLGIAKVFENTTWMIPPKPLDRYNDEAEVIINRNIK